MVKRAVKTDPERQQGCSVESRLIIEID